MELQLTSGEYLTSKGIKPGMSGDTEWALAQSFIHTTALHIGGDHYLPIESGMGRVGGVIVLVGEGGLGKTVLSERFVHQVEDAQDAVENTPNDEFNSVTMIKYMEPEEGSLTSRSQLLAALDAANQSLRPFIVVDSLSSFLYEGYSGGTGSKGLAKSFLFGLTALDVVMARAKRTCVVILNPAEADPDFHRILAVSLNGRVSGVVHFNDTFKGEYSSRYLPDRSSFRQFTMESYGAPGYPWETTAASNQAQDNVVVPRLPVSLQK
jgi:hypothetical protein